MIRLVIVAITVIGFLILSIPILFVEWIIGKFSPRTKEISSLRIIQAVFKFILWEAGTKVTIIGEENVPKDTPVLYIGNHRSYFDIVLSNLLYLTRSCYRIQILFHVLYMHTL